MGDNEVYVMNADGTDPRNLTNSPREDGFPAWSPP
jgi:Tol biopolymer transport system component